MTRKLNEKDVLTFGGFAGTTIARMIETNPKYLRWCHRYVEWFYLDKETLLLVESAIEQQLIDDFND